MAHTLKIAGASYESVSVVHFKDTAGKTCDYVDAEEIAEQAFKGGLTLSCSLVTNNEIEITTKTGETILASKYF